ncbi:MAG: ABC transporter permease [Kyrpidia sp.]|nr:ABC transporter permease [Kyrpidia sp.]
MSGFDRVERVRGRRAEAEAEDAARQVPSPAHAAFLRRQRGRLRRIRGAQWLLLVLVLAAWEGTARMHWVDPMLTSMPSHIAMTFRMLARQGQIGYHTWVTVKETVIGFAVSMGVGGLAAVALWWSSFLSRVLEPYMVVLNALPKVALGPIFYIWLGDRNSIYGMAVAISIVVTVLMLESGFREAGRDKSRLMESLGATRWQMLRLVVVPASVPNVVATMKVNIGLTLVGVIMGEFLSSKAGLGFLILYGGQVFQMDLVMTSIALLVAVSVALYGIIVYAGGKLQRRYHFE